MVNESLMCVRDFQESKETPNSSASQRNAEGEQCFLRSLTRLDCDGESPCCKEHENIDKRSVFLRRLEFRGPGWVDMARHL